MALMNISTVFQANTKVVKRVFLKTAVKVPVYYSKIFNKQTPDMKRPFWTVLPIIGLGTFALRPEGQAPAQDQAFEGTATTFNFVTYALAYKITKEAGIEDAMNVLARLPVMLAYGEQITKELLYWNMLNFGFDATNMPLFDGKALYDAHPLLGLPGTTFSNTAGSTALSVESLQNGFINFHTLVDDRNLPIYRIAKNLIVPVNLHKTAEEVVGSPYYPYSVDNKINVVEGKVNIIVSRYLTSTLGWHLLAGTGDIEADSHSLVVGMKWEHDQRSWIDPQTGNFNHSSEFRSTWGPIDWRGAYGSQGA